MIEINLFEEKKSVQDKAVESLKHLNWKLAIFAVLFFKIPGFVVSMYFKNEVDNLKEKKESVNALVIQHDEYIKKNQEVKDQVKALNDKIAELENEDRTDSENC